MPYTEEQENYFKLITLIYCIGANVNRELLQKFINSRKITLEQFINDHQHEIYHFVCNDKCCQCKTKPIPLNESGVISRRQMQIVFEYPSNDRVENHKKERTGHLCCLKAIKNVELKDLDFTLIKFFLVNFCHQIFWDCLLENVEQTFSEFLEANVHKVYHLSVDKICCCRCNDDREIPKKRINESQFRIIYKKGRSPCHHSYCSCQYSIQSDLTLSLLIQRDNNLATELTRYFCSCRKYLENIYENRNIIAHSSESCINNDIFLDIWKKTSTNILDIAKALNKESEYDAQLETLRNEPTNKDSLITMLLNIIKTSDHVTSDSMQKIENNTNSIENKLDELLAVTKEIQTTTGSNMSSEYASSNNQDDEPVSSECGKCGQIFPTINSFIHHRKDCVRYQTIQSSDDQDTEEISLMSEDPPEANFQTETISETQTCSTKRNKKLLNFVRIEMILQDILVDVLYDLLAQDIEQLRPRSICDISYLYSCHRKNNKHIPSIGWGKYVRDADKAIGDDIERIRDIKNEVQHSITRGIDERQYNRLCNDIVNLLKRFDQCIKPARLYTDRLNEMFAKTISVQEMETVCSIAEKRW